MRFTDQIFKRATISGIVDYLLYGDVPEQKTLNYEERLSESYRKFEKIVLQYAEENHEELLDSANDMTSEVANVYMEIGLQTGILLLKDMLENVSAESFLNHNIIKETE